MDTAAPLPNLQVEKELLTWISPARPYKTRTREFYTTIASIAFLLGVILLLLKEFLLIGVIMAFAFMSYVLASHKPENVTHVLSTKGVKTDNKPYDWSAFTHFWLENQYSQEVVILKTIAPLPGIVLMVVDPKVREDIVKTIGSYLPLDKPEATFVDKASSWLGKKVPLENN